MPSAEAIVFVEDIHGYTGFHVPKQVVTLDLNHWVEALRGELDGISAGRPEISVIDSLKVIIDAASALRQYARHLSLDLSTYNHAAELQLRAERKAGQWLTKHLDE